LHQRQHTGIKKREEHESRKVIWQIAPRRSTYSRLNKRSLLYKAKRKIEYCKSQTRAKVEHPFRVIKRQFGYVKVRFRGLMKNAAQLTTPFALSNLWMARKQLMGMGELRILHAENGLKSPTRRCARDVSRPITLNAAGFSTCRAVAAS
jgi:IS5 family transposase